MELENESVSITEEVLKAVEKPPSGEKEEISVMDEIPVVEEIPADQQTPVTEEIPADKKIEEIQKQPGQPVKPDFHPNGTQMRRLSVEGLSDDDSQSLSFIMKEKLLYLAGDIRRRTSQVLN